MCGCVCECYIHPCMFTGRQRLLTPPPTEPPTNHPTTHPSIQASSSSGGSGGRYIISSAESVTPAWIAGVLARRFPGRFPRMGQVGAEGGGWWMREHARMRDAAGA